MKMSLPSNLATILPRGGLLAILTTLSIGLSGMANPGQLAADTNDSAASDEAAICVFTAPPQQVPSRKVVDGPLLGNGDLGVVVAGPPEWQRFHLSKNDFWKAKPIYPNAHPCPIGTLDVRIPALTGGSYHAEQRMDRGEVWMGHTTARRWTDPPPFTRAGQTVHYRAWTPATRNLLVIELWVEGDPNDPSNAAGVDVSLTPKAGNEAETESGNLRDGYWAVRRFRSVADGNSIAVDQQPLVWQSEAAVAMCVLNHRRPLIPGGDGWSADRFLLVPGQTVQIVAAVVTSEEVSFGETRAEATRRVEAVTAESLADLRAEHDRWWSAFWAKSRVAIGDPFLERHYRASQYILACSSRNPRFAPSLFGNWITEDAPSWQADYHMNYNHQAPWWAVYSSNHVELSEPYDTPILEAMERGRLNADRYLKVPGVYYEVGIGPKALESTLVAPGHEIPGEGNRMFLGSKANALLCTTNMLMRFYATYDEAYARKVYPFLRNVADFWESYMKLEDGRYVVYGDSIGETGDGGSDKNNIYTLGLLRMFFQGLVDVSETLNADTDRREKWRHILAHLSDLPTAEADGVERFRLAEGGPSSRLLGPNAGAAQNAWNCHFLGIVWPGTTVGLATDPRLLRIAAREVRDWPDGDWYNKGTNPPTFRTTFASYPYAARVGHDPEDLLRRLRTALERDAYPNGWWFTGGGGIEQCSGVPGCINEMLMQSHQGAIHLFPNWPRSRDARFEQLRANGAFLVSAECKDGAIGPVHVLSEKGRTCRVLNPWPDRTIMVRRRGEVSEVRGTTLELPTTAGESLTLEPY